MTVLNLIANRIVMRKIMEKFRREGVEEEKKEHELWLGQYYDRRRDPYRKNDSDHD